MLRKKWWLVIIGLVLGAALAWFVVPRLMPHTFHGTIIQSPDPAPDFTLTGRDGQRVSLSDFRDRLVVLYFGYTFCPDVCPATLTELAGALRMIGKKADQVQVIMISVDPERDTPDRTAEYVSKFNPSFVGLSGDPDEIAQVAALYGIFYEKKSGESPEKYTVDHTASLMVIDPKGHLKLVIPFGVRPSDIAEDLDALLR